MFWKFFVTVFKTGARNRLVISERYNKSFHLASHYRGVERADIALVQLN